MDRKYHIVLLGATGYTGKLCVEYMVKTLHPHLNWAIAGRNKERLDTISKDLGVNKAGSRRVNLMIDQHSLIPPHQALLCR